MRKIILIAQTSADGFVAGPNGEFDKFIDDDENLEFVCTLIEDADAIVSGRTSFQLLDSAWPTAAQKPTATKSMITYSKWYNSVPKYVLSNTLQIINSPNTHILRDNLPAAINKLKEQNGKTMLIFGSPSTVHALLTWQVIDEIWLIVHPVIFGRGIPLFTDRENTIKLNLNKTKQLSNGIIAINYKVEKLGN